MRQKITLENNFHGTEVDLWALVAENGDLLLSAGQMRKAEGVLCGCDGCACGKIRPAGQIDDRYPDGSAIIWGEVDDE